MRIRASVLWFKTIAGVANVSLAAINQELEATLVVFMISIVNISSFY